MKLSLAENIRMFRKQKKMTQEKLAEALGVTVGAVYKWESGLSQPELGMLVELADFFDISVDVLIGYRTKDNRMEAMLERINAYCQVMDPTAISEAEKLQEDIREKLDYQKSPAFIEDIAREKLGLIFENEIIFKRGK